MPNMIKQLRSGTVVGYAGLGARGGVPGSVRQQVHDGDTITVRAATENSSAEIGNLGVRFLGVDAPEISFTLPGGRGFIGLSDPRWEQYLSDPFKEAFDPPLSAGLLENLRAGVGPGAAMNHYRYAAAAEQALEEAVLKDIRELNQTEADFRFFLAFAHEVMDRYGRFLCFINRYQARNSQGRPRSYNERLLEAGKVSPYFIWPNIDPFRRAGSVVKAVPAPGTAGQWASESEALRRARRSVQAARERGLGIFDAHDPLRLQPFEVRFLGRRARPDRWLIDLSRDDDVLIRPQQYYTVPRLEDRLFIPEEYVPLFEERGWHQQEA